MNIPIPPDVNFILNELTKNAYEAYVVGGSIRDSLMGKTPSDWDMSTNATPDAIINIFSTLGLKTISTGKLFGTITLLIHNQPYEITTFRTESNYEDNRKPSNVTFSSSIDEDLRRRDFTINSLAYDPHRGLIDLFHGVEDIHNKIIRAVGDPEERFQEDALRILRAIRFASQLDFTIHPKTAEAMDQHRELVKTLSKERVRTELDKIIMSDRPTLGLKLLNTLEIIHPIQIPDNLDTVKKDLIYRLSLLGIVNIYTHGIPLNTLTQRLHVLEKALKELRYDGHTIKQVVFLIKEYPSIRNLTNERSFKKLLSRNGIEAGKELLSLSKDVEVLPWNSCMGLNDLELLLTKIIEEDHPIALKDLKISGDTLKAMGITEGREVGIILNHLLEIVLEKPEFNQYDKLLELTSAYIKSKKQ